MFQRILFLSFLTSTVYCTEGFGQDCFSEAPHYLSSLASKGVDFPKRNKMALETLVGCVAPDFRCKSTGGDSVSLSSLKGKVVMINFWYEGCAPCIAEIPALNRLADEFKNQDVVFLGIGRDSQTDIIRFLKQREFKFTLIPDDAMAIAELYCCRSVSGWPMSLVIDQKGIVRKIMNGGYVDERAETFAYDEFQPTIAKLLEN